MISNFPLDTGGKLKVHKTFRRRSERLLNVSCTFSLHPVSRGSEVVKSGKWQNSILPYNNNKSNCTKLKEKMTPILLLMSTTSSKHLVYVQFTSCVQGVIFSLFLSKSSQSAVLRYSENIRLSLGRAVKKKLQVPL